MSGSWTPTGNLRGVRQGHTATLLPNGQVLVAAGVQSRTGFFFLSSAELFDPASGTWRVTGSLATPRSNHTATAFPNGQVLVVGGQNLTAYLASAELYASAAPVIISPLAASGTLGLPFVYQFQATGATSLATTNLPPGLGFDTSLKWITRYTDRHGNVPSRAERHELHRALLTPRSRLLCSRSRVRDRLLSAAPAQPAGPGIPSVFNYRSSMAVLPRTIPWMSFPRG